jgi:hypothetical protein
MWTVPAGVIIFNGLGARDILPERLRENEPEADNITNRQIIG